MARGWWSCSSYLSRNASIVVRGLLDVVNLSNLTESCNELYADFGYSIMESRLNVYERASLYNGRKRKGIDTAS